MKESVPSIGTWELASHRSLAHLLLDGGVVHNIPSHTTKHAV